MSASYVVVVQGPSVPPAVRELGAPRVVIGREAGDIVVPDPRCSSTHAEIVFDGRSVRVKDLGSTNGTLVNGARVDDIAWTPGMVLQIGAHTLTLREVRVPGPVKGKTIAGNVMLGGPPPGAPPPGAPGGGPPAGYPGSQGAVPAAAPYGYAPAAPAGGMGAPGYGQAPPVHGYGAMPGAGHGYGAPPGVMGPGFAPPKKGPPLWLIAIPVALLGACGLAGGALYLMGAEASSSSAPVAAGGGPVLTEAREANVRFVWYAGEPGPTAKGGTSPARIRVGPNKAGTVSVGVSEEFAGGGGNQWRTATWLAAFNTTRTTGGSLSDYEFNVHVGGHVDGPSAGMLTTSSMIALLRGKTLRTDTTMTGTINPDGTAGPVGGIVQKMQGAKADGLARFGFPIGARQHKDMKTGQTVDLMTVGAGLGLEVKEISDVYEAYEFMTGDTLPRAAPVADGEMEPSAESQALLRAKVATWKARVDREIGGLKAEVKRTGAASQIVGPLVQEADKAFAQAQQYERNGFMMPALEQYANTAIQISSATKLVTAIFHVQRNDINSLIAAVNTSSNVKPEVESYGAQLEVKAHGKTRGGQVSTTFAFTHYVMARGATMIGDDFLGSAQSILKAAEAGQLKNVPAQKVKEVVVEKATTTMLYYEIARVYLDFAKDLQDLIVDEGTAAPMDSASVDRTVKGYASASAAVLAYFDALITDEVAREKNVSADEAKGIIAAKEPDYYLARKANMLSEYTGTAATTDGAKLMRLGAASFSYISGAKLVNKWYSLSASLDKDGKLVLENRRALTAQLDLARRTAKEAAARAKGSAGFIPSAARMTFQNGNALREGSDEDKLNALASYWQATFWSELAATGGGGTGGGLGGGAP